MSTPAHTFVESLALWFEQSGVPRMAGRVLGWLLVCDPPHQSADEVAAALRASRGSISTTTRSLLGTGLIERITFPGDRRTYYRALPDWSSLIEAQYKRVTELRRIVDEGLEALADEPAARRERLDEVNRFATFWEQQLAAILAERVR